MLTGGSDVVSIGQKALTDNPDVDVMAQLKSSVLKEHGHEDGDGMDLTAVSAAEPRLVWCCGRQLLSRHLARAATFMMTWTITIHKRCCFNGP